MCFSGALTTSCICCSCCSSRMAHPFLLWLEGLLFLLAESERARLDPCRPLTCCSTVTASHQWLILWSRPEWSSPRRPSVSSAGASSDTTEPHCVFSGGFTETESVSDLFFFPLFFPKSIIPVSWLFGFWLFALNKNLVINIDFSAMCD